MEQYEPLEALWNLYSFPNKEIREFALGDKYCGVMLQNGNIGVCSTLGVPWSFSELPQQPDSNQSDQRILMQAMLNARLNYDGATSGESDIFDHAGFESFRNTVMIGYFESLCQKFEKAGLKPKIFDLQPEKPVSCEMAGLFHEVSFAEAIIITSTSITNRTFMPVMEACHPRANVFLLGPSSTVHTFMFNYRHLKTIYGSLFEPYDNEVLNIIRNNGGTRDFMTRMKKVYLNR